MGDEVREFTRSNRGARMQLLIGEALAAAQSGETAPPIRGSDVQIGEIEGEAITYNDYFNESSDAGSYVQSSEQEDYVDSDFVTDDEDEDDDIDEAENELKSQEKAEKKKAKKGAYVDPAKRTKQFARAGESDSDGSEGARSAKGSKGQRKGTASEQTGGGRTDRSFRSSTQIRSEISKATATEAAKMKQESAKNRPVAEERRYTQEELLAEAKLTAVENVKDLQRLVRIEEDMKKVVWNKAPLTGPRIHWRSSSKIETVTWTDPSTMPASFSQPCPPVPKKVVCVITGLPALYRDPLTGHPYANLKAFKQLREQYSSTTR